MQITIGQYEDLQVNNSADLVTYAASIKVPGRRGGIGRVDHFMKTSFKKIVDAYVRQVVRREAVLGVYELTITTRDGYLGKTLTDHKILITAA
jgi:hypothetical protein